MKSFVTLFTLMSASIAFAQPQFSDVSQILLRSQLINIKAYNARAVKDPSHPVEGENVIVAVIDSGLNIFHPQISDRIFINRREIPNNGIDDDNNGFIDDYQGWNFVANNHNVHDDNGHGTHVAGIIAGEQGGVAPKAQILPIKACDADGSCPTDNVIKAIKYAASMGARIANLSLIIHDTTFGTRIKFIDVVNTAKKYGILLVTAAGNYSQDNDNFVIYPKAINSDNIISVCSVSANNFLSDFSHFGKQSVDLCAYGENVISLNASYSTFSNNQVSQTVTMSGTSMAAPFVTGTAALIASASPYMTAVQIRNAIRNGARVFIALKDLNATWGVLDAELAMKKALNKQ